MNDDETEPKRHASDATGAWKAMLNERQIRIAETRAQSRPQAIHERQPQRRRGRAWLALLSLPLVLFLALPLLAILLRTPPGLLLSNLQQPAVMQAIGLSFATTTITTLLTILMGTPLAYLLARYSFRGRALLDTLIDAPIVLPPAVAGVGLLLAFGRRGIWGSYLDDLGLTIAFTQAAVVLAQLFVSAPLYIKAATTGFMSVDRELEQAAALDGASGLQVFRLITAPLTFPVLCGGVVMAWARALGEFGATIIFAGNLPGRTQTMPLAIYIGFELELSVALTLSVILLGCSFGVLMITKALLKRQIAPEEVSIAHGA
ncbi:MAG TPA: ABC transporter permease [Herpetosiphonaceae bacterium]